VLLQLTAYVAGAGGHFLFRNRAPVRRAKNGGKVSCQQCMLHLTCYDSHNP
jgi:hypothetical protein